MRHSTLARVAARLAVLWIAVGTTSAFAAFTSISTAVEATTSSGVNTAIRASPRAYQGYFAANQFTSIITPQTITGIQLRLAIGENWRPAGFAGSAWPDAPISLSSYEIVLAKASPTLITDGEYLSLTPNFSSYLVDPVTVRTGPLSIAAGAFPADGGAAGIHSWGPIFSFSTPYTFNPGDSLIVQIRHTGYGTTGTPLNAFFASNSFSNGSFDAISSTTGANAAAPSGFSSPYFFNFQTAPIPEPSAASLLAAPALLLLTRKRS